MAFTFSVILTVIYNYMLQHKMRRHLVKKNQGESYLGIRIHPVLMHV